jgi:hypothetical protein
MSKVDIMLKFLTPDLFNIAIWALIVVGVVAAVARLIRDLTGPPRWPDGPPSGDSPDRQEQASNTRTDGTDWPEQ